MPTITSITRAARSRRSAAVALIVAGAALLLAYPGLDGAPAHHVHVRWKPGVAEADRHGYERSLGLREDGAASDRSFGYDLTDPSSANIRAILEHPAVEDTHDLDRSAFTVSPLAPRTDSRTGWAWQWGVEGALVPVRWTARAAILLGVLLLLPPVDPRPLVARVRRFVETRPEVVIPRLGPASFGLFRIAFGLMLLVWVLDGTMDPSGMPLEQQRNIGLLDVAWLHQLAATPGALLGLERLLIASLACFIVGLASHASFVVFTLAALPWTFGWAFRAGTHPLGPLPLALLVLLVAPWNDGWGVSWWWRRTPVARRWALAPRGFAPWVLCVAVSAGFAAAAYSKVGTGPAWILNGTVRYHFMAESNIAPVTWGTWIAARPALAIAASFVAVATEATLFVAVLIGNPWMRFAYGLSAAALFTGFFLFHNALWPAWWTMLLGFVPWGVLDRQLCRSADVVDASRPRRIAWVAVLLLVVQQLVVTSLHAEWPPFFSAYDMYSSTFSSVEAFQRSNGGPRLTVLAITPADPRDVADCVRRDRAAVDELTAVAGQDGPAPIPDRARERVTTCATRVGGATAVRVLADQRIYDFENGRSYYKYRDRVLGEWPLR